MLKIYPEKLSTQLQKELRSVYLLTGNDPLIQQEAHNQIITTARAAGFTEKLSQTIDSHTDWPAIFMACQSPGLFSSRQILNLQFAENGPNAQAAEQLLQLNQFLHSDLLLILQLHKFSRTQEQSPWCQKLLAQGIHVPCQAPDIAQLPAWINARTRTLELQLDAEATRLLCYCYEGNSLALAQTLQKLALLWPASNITLPRAEAVVNDATVFSPYQWIDALLAGKSKRAIHILHQLQHEEIEIVILLRSLQRELIMLLELSLAPKSALRTAMDKLRIWQTRRALYIETLQRLSRSRLIQITQQLAKLERAVKQDYAQSVWPYMETLTLLFCMANYPIGLLDV
jgi:DNA polymerase III subunit delta